MLFRRRDLQRLREGRAGSLPPPLTLGHENAGWVEALGPGVSGISAGDAFLVYGSIRCGHCGMCSRGQDTYYEAEEAGRIAQDIPTNHNPRFAQVIRPALESGVQPVTAAALDALDARTT